MNCRKCGAPIKDGYDFCRKCATPVEDIENKNVEENNINENTFNINQTIIEEKNINLINENPYNGVQIENKDLVNRNQMDIEGAKRSNLISLIGIIIGLIIFIGVIVLIVKNL